MKRIFSLILGVCVTLSSCTGDANFSQSDAGGGSGRGGSLARFTIIGEHLYTVNGNNLKTFSIANQNTRLKSVVSLNAFAETIFPFKDHLLIGTRTGMHIYGLQDEDNPNFVSQYQHFASCDPVVAQGNYAFVTLRNGTPCMWGQNQLDILDISNFNIPVIKNSVQMVNPQGLSANGSRLYVCEGNNGLAIFDIQEPEQPVLEKYLNEVKPFDVIAYGNQVLLTGEDGISQYAVNQNDELQLLSTIKIGE
ncbi:LVIVD repeat-containing protein [Jiulongibacter sp. NS-SX5]|uniref:LVIVD repeat-containing protein n=1 Tax=Jiulongibacter sp. NS-SX5 TaxID=3463854 RepID=UPI004058EABA